jgi:outer membrane protease
MVIMRWVLFSFFLFQLSIPLFSQNALELESFQSLNGDMNRKEPTFFFNIGLDEGVMFGMLQEWVFINRGGNTGYNDVLSRIDWQQSPQFYIGATGSIMPFPRFFIGFGGWLGIPSLLGYFEDRDWDPITGIYSGISHMQNTLINSVFYDINLGYSFIYDTNTILNLLIGFNFKQISMYAQNGWDEVPPGGPPVLRSDRAIDYEINFFIPYIGIELKYSPVPVLSLDTFLSISPWITFIYDRDFHHTSPWGPEYFQDLPQWGFYFSGVISLCFHIANGWNIRLKNTIMWSPPIKGPSFLDGSLSGGELAGASLLLGGVSLSVNWPFGLYKEAAPEHPDIMVLPR